MDILIRAMNLHERFSAQMEKAEEIERQNFAQVMPKIRDLKDDLIENREIARQMIEEINKSAEMNPTKTRKLENELREPEEDKRKLEEKIRALEEKVSKLEQKIASVEKEKKILQDKNKNLRDKVAEHDIRFAGLQTGQIAFDFEKDVATYIYPNGKRIGSHQIFTNMKKWLENKKGTLEGNEANTKWNDLQREFSWSVEHEGVFFKLLKYRREFAHPVVDPRAVRSQIPDDFTDQEKRCNKDIIAMIERMNELMQ